MTARGELTAALEAVAGDVPVAPAPVRNGAPPLFVIAPGTPYMRPTTVPGCAADWRLDVWCIVPKEAVDALDRQDALAQLVADAVATMPTGQWLGINRAGISFDDLAGVPALATVVEIRVTR